MNDYKFGNFLCELREFKGFTQAELAQLLSVTPAAVSKWENGESKPRIETLFKLAEILDVTAEELMAGEFAVKQEDAILDETSKRYEYLRGLDNLLTVRVRISRICAFIFDWCLMGFFTVALSSILFLIYPVQGKTVPETNGEIIVLVMLVSMVVWFISFAFRDFIFKGRSIGKRVFGLMVIDRNSGLTPSKKQLLMRNLFFFISTIDGILMLLRGISIGDSVAQTFVVSKVQLEYGNNADSDIDSINSYIPAKREKKRIVGFLTIGAIFYVLIGVLMLFIMFGMEKSEPYQVAYNYLVESESFKKLNVDEDRVKWSSISLEGIIDKSDTNEIVFSVEGKEYEVISHRENGAWNVCEECTKFR